MIRKISNSFELVKASGQVLKVDKELMVFPLLSGAATLLVTATFIAPIFVSGGLHIFFTETGEYTFAGMAAGFLFYVVQYSVIFFFNAALVGAALIRLDGGDPTISDGLAIASKRMGSIIGYAVLAATVGMILRMIAERSGFLGRIAAGLVGMAWTLATYLTVPVLVTKDIGPIDAVKESAMVFKRTWGEQVAGNMGIGWAATIAMLGWSALSFFVMYAAAQIAPGAAFGAAGIWFLGCLVLGMIASALNGIYTAALYRYAMTGQVANFNPTVIGNAFRPK